MSKRSGKKNKGRVNQKPLERSEQPQAKELQAEVLPAEEPQVEVLPAGEPQVEVLQTEVLQAVDSQEEPLSEEPWLEELWQEDFWPGETQTQDPQTESPEAEPLEVEPQAVEILAEEPLEEEPRAEEPPERSDTKRIPPKAPKKAKSSRVQKIVMAVMIVVAVLMVMATALLLLHNRWFKKPSLPSPAPSQTAPEDLPSAAIPTINPPGPDATQEIVTVQPLAGGQRKSADFYTILIFGSDQISGLTDTIMVASYDVTNQRATVLSIPRDTLVNNYYLDKANKSINATYKQNGRGTSGVTALKTEVSRLIGFVPDFYVTINWELVGQMVDAIGGVYFDVPWHMGYDDPTQDLHIHFEEGYQYLDGKAAMNLVRWRKNNDGKPGGGSDLNRLGVQHVFLKAVLKQTLQPQNIVHIPELIRLFNDNVVSDLAVENMLWFGEQAVLGGLNADNVEFLTMPVYGTTNANGRYYGKVCAITDQLLPIVNRSLNPYVEDVTLLQLDLIQMNTDGNILSSTTGTLRNPASGVFVYPEDPNTSDPPEDDPGVTDPVESDPVTSEPVESDPVTSEPVESDPVTSEPVESDPVASEPVESDPVTSEPVESDPVTSEPVESDPVTSEPVESDPVASEPVESGPEPAQTDNLPQDPEPSATGGDRADDENR